MASAWRRAFGGFHSALYRTSGGRVGGSIDGLSVLLLTTTGRRSGRPRRTPLLYVDDGDGYALAASYAGADRHPAWYHNLVAEPEVTVRIRNETKRMRATEADEPDRTRIYEQLKRASKQYARYEAKTDRRIPVVLLRDVAQAEPDSSAA